MDSQNAALDQGLNVLISPVAERRPRERVAPSCSPDRSARPLPNFNNTPRTGRILRAPNNHLIEGLLEYCISLKNEHRRNVVI